MTSNKKPPSALHFFRFKKQGITRAPDPLATLKKGIWLYFLLLLFEGALRKWVLPGLANPLLIVRDPVAVWLLYTSIRKELLPANTFITLMSILGVVSVVTAMVFGHGSLPVALFGARILLLHFPLIFVIGRIFNRDDVVEMGKVTLMIAIPMAVLIALQFYSPQSAWVNRGVGGSLEGAGFSGALGYFRPPGTFSFTNGNTQFFGFVAPFIFFFWLTPESKLKKIVLVLATGGLLVAIPLSISRSLFFSVLVTVMFAFIAVAFKPKYFSKIVFATVMLVVSLAILSQLSFFKTATEAFTYRFEGANESEGGIEGVLGNRYLGSMTKALTGGSSKAGFFGYGIGMGSNVGAMLLTGGSGRVLSEDDWGRWVDELGTFLGVSFILLRLVLGARIFFAGYAKLQMGDVLPWLLLSFCLLNLPQGEWAQPTSLGFSIMSAGLTIASLRKPRSKVPAVSAVKANS